MTMMKPHQRQQSRRGAVGKAPCSHAHIGCSWRSETGNVGHTPPHLTPHASPLTSLKSPETGTTHVQPTRLWNLGHLSKIVYICALF